MGNQLVSINGYAIRNDNNLQWDMGAACRVLGIHEQMVAGVAQDFTRDRLIVIHESTNRYKSRGDTTLLLQLDYNGVPQQYRNNILETLFPIFRGPLPSPPTCLLCGQLILLWQTLTDYQQRNVMNCVTPNIILTGTQTALLLAQHVAATAETC